MHVRINGTKYSTVNQVKLWKTAFKKNLLGPLLNTQTQIKYLSNKKWNLRNETDHHGNKVC